MEPSARREPVSVRAVGIGLLATIALCGLTPYNDYKIAATYIAGNHLPIGSFFLLALLILGGNTVLRRLRPSAALRPGELVTIWAMTVVSSGLPSSGLFRYLTPHIVAGLHFATPENGWAGRVLAHLPAALQITDADAVRYFYDGLYGRAGLPWHVWLRPLTVYGVFAAALFGAFICLSVIMRRQWVDHERFTFPIVQLPVEMAQAPGDGHLLPPFFRDGGMWAAVALMTLIHTMNGLHQVWAAVPEVRLYAQRLEGLTGRGWRAWNYTGLPVYPLTVGFSYLLNNEVLLSLWLFHVLYKVELMVADWWGLTPTRVGMGGYGSEAFASQQAAGAALALTAWMLYTGRHHYLRVLRRAFGGPRSPGEADEGLTYRAAVVGFAFCMALMLAWLARLGGQLGMAAGVLVFAFASYVTLSWMVCQAGLLFVQPVWAGREMMVRLFGSGAFTPRSILVASQVEYIFALDLREFVLPHLLNVQKAGDAVPTSRRGLLGAMALALVAGFVVSAYTTIRLPYDYGAGVGLNNAWTYQMSPLLPIRYLDSLLNVAQPVSSGTWWNLTGGFAGMWLVMLWRTSVSWFRLHPAGFIIASGYPIRCFWVSFLIGWVAKNAILKAGGLRLYRRARPFFLGLVVGDCLNGAVWVILSALLNVRYQILPG